MKKITDLTEERWRTTHERDITGRLQKGRVKYIAKRVVRTVTTGPRIGHAFIDFICVDLVAIIFQYFMALALLGMPVGALSITMELVMSLCALLFFPAMYIGFEYKWQRTPGKFVTKTRVVNEYGDPPDLSAILLRTVIRLVPFEAFSCFGDPYSRGWHDKWSGTFVVPDEELKRLKELQAEQSATTVVP
ncbi:MAG: RDD family protein [Flavobacteriales bacterium]|nr:RDD family protein [Flavobacteriales bacterium]